MNQEELAQTAAALKKIPKKSWDTFLNTNEGSTILEAIRQSRATLRDLGLIKGPPNKSVDAILSILGDGLLTDRTVGPWVRAMLIQTLPPPRWIKLRNAYAELHGKNSQNLHGNSSQFGKGADTIAEYWHQGSAWATTFCEICRLPHSLASRRLDTLPDDEAVEASQALPPLHSFQAEVYKGITKLLNGPNGTSAVLSLPTGAGKTRVAVEALLDHLAQQEYGAKRSAVLWIAQSEELLRQAWDCIRQVWQTAPEQRNHKQILRRGILTIRRVWGGGLDLAEMEIDEGPTVLLAGIQQLNSWFNKPGEAPPWPMQRFVAVVVDEAHRLMTSKQRRILVNLGLCQQYRWKPLMTSPPIIGLTATPWRTQEKSDKEFLGFFQRKLLTPKLLTDKPIRTLQNKKYLSKIKFVRLLSNNLPEMTPKQKKSFDKFKDLPNDYLAAIGRHPQRNALIVRRLLRLPKKASVLVFACSVEHAEFLTLTLKQAGRSARCVTGKTPRHERLSILNAFKGRDINFVINVGVLTTGFDAPKIDVICITRPTGSALLYEQMVGRGLRGPKNGGTPFCTVLDLQDTGLPTGIMSYERVLELWDS